MYYRVLKHKKGVTPDKMVEPELFVVHEDQLVSFVKKELSGSSDNVLVFDSFPASHLYGSSIKK